MLLGLKGSAYGQLVKGESILLHEYSLESLIDVPILFLYNP